MLTRSDLHLSFVPRMTKWGLKLGIVLGFIFPVFYFVPTQSFDGGNLDFDYMRTLLPGVLICASPIGTVIGAIIGTALGYILGIILAFITRTYASPLRNVQQYLRTVTFIAVFIGLAGGVVGFLLVGNGFEFLLLMPAFIITTSIITSCSAAFAANRVAKWYVNTVLNTIDFGGGHVEQK